jgi:hypothetical protein
MTDEERAELAQWAKDARQRSRRAILRLLRQKRQAESRLFDTEDRMGRADEEYCRALLTDTHPPSVSSRIQVTKRETPLARS